MKARLVIFSIMITAMMVLSPVAYAVPGDVLAVINTAVPSPSGVAIGIAVDCEDPANLYYTHSFSPFLYKMDKFGNNLGNVPLTDSVTGGPITIGAIAWDQTRLKIWGGSDSGAGNVRVYLIDPATGVSTHVFTLTMVSFRFCDGIGFDGSDDSIWITDDVTNWVEHWDLSGVDANGVGAAVQLATIFPVDAAGNSITLISGVVVGKGNLLYLGRNGLGKITRVDKNGTFDSEFTTIGGRDEDMECDTVSFAPLLVLWSKDAFNNTVSAIEVEPDTCECGGGGDDVAPGPPTNVNPGENPKAFTVSGGTTITATVSDAGTGDSIIVGADISIDGGIPVPMAAADGTFDAVTEDVTIDLDLSGVLPGLYEVCITATDANGNVSAPTCYLCVIYDPDAGFVTGGGWIDSPAGAYKPDPSLEGKATFGFVSKYKKGKSTPDGNTEFQFHAAGMNFHSSSYDWLVVANTKAMFRGEGTINGAGPFKFFLTAHDEVPDKFRIRIWEEPAGVEIVLYDNQMGDDDDADASTVISNGQIMIHVKGKK